ncbi:MAG: hypothetical protein LBM77_05110 [Spirochaetaceae bacterium]|nr:hypothetical protein [Spirochaetaceae bacterium]
MPLGEAATGRDKVASSAAALSNQRLEFRWPVASKAASKTRRRTQRQVVV